MGEPAGNADATPLVSNRTKGRSQQLPLLGVKGEWIPLAFAKKKVSLWGIASPLHFLAF